MSKGRHMTAFYLETILMVIIFALVIAILAQVFGLAKAQSREAALTTDAVCLAQNAAEAVGAADSIDALCQLLDENGNAAADGAGVTAWYDGSLQPESAEAAAADASAMRLEATWEPMPSAAGTFVDSNISVYAGTAQQPVYTLHTGIYLRGQEVAR